MKILKILILIVVLGGLIILGARGYYFAAVKRPSQVKEAKELTVEKGWEVSEIADRLYEKKLINSKALLKIYLKLNGWGATLEAGEYKIPAGLNLKETVKHLQHGTFDVKVTFLEGWRREEAAAYAAEELKHQMPSSKDFEEEFLEASEGMEGYLFPDTYRVEKGTTAEEMVGLLREMFDKKVTADLINRARERDLSLREVVILASIVEREVPTEEDRPQVAGILIKRWRNDWPLEADATTQFAVATISNQRSAVSEQQEWWPEKLTDRDLKVDSPYNTRKYKGLPPGPICNPGLDAIKAVVNYKKTPYWYYLSDGEGNTYYSKTLDEHNANVVRYLGGR